ncbi:MAG: TIGR03435 family protein [Terracidiphilus sp.]
MRSTIPEVIAQRRFVLCLGFLFACCAAACAIAQQASFEAATIKPTPNPDPGQGYWSLPGIGRFSAHSLTVQFLIQMAYGVEADQISGKPSWLDSNFYDVEAKPEEGIKLSREELKPRLQNLLAERFRLAAHFETKMVRGYALIVAKGGPKLQTTKGDHFPGFRISAGAGHLEGLNWSMPYLAKMLQHTTDLPVADQTGIAGSYDIKLQFAPDIEQDSTLPTVFTALRETLGLELKAQQVPIQVLVIDHIDRVPVAN